MQVTNNLIQDMSYKKINIHLKLTRFLVHLRACTYIVFFLFLCFNNKAVVGSGSEGAPKYVGEGVAYGVFLQYS